MATKILERTGHRDLKPHNIFLLDQGGVGELVKIVDFGIAYAGSARRPAEEEIVSASSPALRPINAASLANTLEIVAALNAEEHDPEYGAERYTLPGTVLGTPHYMPPEQVRASAVDARSDQYALGCILYEMLTGAVPFENPDIAVVLNHHLTVPPPSMRARYPHLGIPEMLESLVLRMLAKDPRDRWPSMRAVEAALEQEIEFLLVERGEKMTVAAASSGNFAARTSATLPVHKPRPRPWKGLAAGLLLVCPLLGYGGYRYFHGRPQAVAPAMSPAEQASLRQRAIDILRLQLSDSDQEVRIGAVSALGQTCDPAQRAAIESLLRDRNAEVRGQAAAALAQLGDRGALPALHAVLDRPQELTASVRVAVAGALDQLGDVSGRELLQAALESTDEEARQKAAFVLSEHAYPQAVELLQLLSGQRGLSPALELAITARLAQVGDAKARERLRAQLGRPMETSLPVAARLAQLGDEQGRAMLRTVADKPGPQQLTAARFLAAPDEPAVAELCRRVLRSPQASLPARLLALEALGLAGSLADAPLLGQQLMAAGEARHRRAAALAVVLVLGRQPDALSEQSLRWAESALADNDWVIRQSVAVVLGDSGEPRALPLLAGLMKDQDARVRARAAQALDKSETPLALQALRAGFTDADPAVRTESLRALLQSAELLSVRGARTLVDEVGGWLRGLLAPGASATREQVLVSAALLRMGDTTQRVRLRAHLDEQNADLRAFVAEQLSDVELLLVALRDSAQTVRLAAAKSLGRLGDQRAIPVLQEALQGGGLQSVTAYGLLRKLGVAVPEHFDRGVAALLTDKEVTNRLAAVDAIAALPVEQAVPLLALAARDAEPAVRQQVAEVAGELPRASADGLPAGLPVLRRLAADRDLVVRVRATAVVARLLRGASPRPPQAEEPARSVATTGPVPVSSNDLSAAAPPVEVALRDLGAAVADGGLPAGSGQRPPADAGSPPDGASAVVGTPAAAADAIAALIQSGKRAYEQRNYAQAQKLLERAHSRCLRAGADSPPCTSMAYDASFFLAKAYQEQQRWPEAMTEYADLLERAPALNLDPDRRNAIAQEMSRLQPKLGRVLVRKLVNKRCQTSTLWTLPGPVTVNLGSTTEDVVVHANETIPLGACR